MPLPTPNRAAFIRHITGLLGLVVLCAACSSTPAPIPAPAPNLVQVNMANPTVTVANTATVQLDTPTATLAPSSMPTVPPVPTVTPISTETPSPLPTQTPSPTVPPPPPATATKLPTQTPLPVVPATQVPGTATATPAPVVVAAPSAPTHVGMPRLVLGNYFAWFDGDGWDGCNISAGDKPLQPYSSDDPATIARHIQMAANAGLAGFTLQWFTPGDRTDRNFRTLLEQSRGKNFQSSVVFLRHIWHGDPHPAQQQIVASLSYLVDQYSHHPQFLQVLGKPVIFFVDMTRVPTVGGQTPQQAWAAIRQQVDPQGKMLWIAEGLDPSYLETFDGLYVYKITHAAYPNDYLKDGNWAAQVHQWEEKTGKTKLWIGTLSPGWDDLRSGCKNDVRLASPAHKEDRGNGNFYQATFDAAVQSQPDWLWLHSFNEWVEGTYIEPGLQYGDKYMDLTRLLSAAFKR
ncbi:MAG: hypothetical protein EXR62_16985 [Chloroflexi bacterium]|nr:hypothetical protein [Chloroflexota bacterium]